MRVLFTNHGLNLRAGTELYVRDIAVALLKRGHEPWCWSTELGAVADELRAEGVLVVSSLADLPGQPDLIHGHHRLETTAAGMYFPDVPVISYCHGPRAWQERPCRLGNVAFWIAVDEPAGRGWSWRRGLNLTCPGPAELCGYGALSAAGAVAAPPGAGAGFQQSRLPRYPCAGAASGLRGSGHPAGCCRSGERTGG